jgi:hypothetical protein
VQQVVEGKVWEVSFAALGVQDAVPRLLGSVLVSLTVTWQLTPVVWGFQRLVGGLRGLEGMGRSRCLASFGV